MASSKSTASIVGEHGPELTLPQVDEVPERVVADPAAQEPGERPWPGDQPCG